MTVFIDTLTFVLLFAGGEGEEGEDGDGVFHSFSFIIVNIVSEDEKLGENVDKLYPKAANGRATYHTGEVTRMIATYPIIDIIQYCRGSIQYRS